MTQLLTAVSSHKAIAGMAGAVGIQLAAPLLNKIPGIGNPIGRVLIGVVVAWVGVNYLEDTMEAIVVGIGAGLIAQGLLAFALPQLSVVQA